MKKFFLALVLLAPWCFAGIANGDMSSTHYQIYADSIGVDGGNFSSSTSFSLTDTIGEPAAGTVSSTDYEVRGGFQAMDRGTLVVSVGNGGTINMGTLSPKTVGTASVDVAISTDSATGYELSISSVSGPAPLADVVPPAVVTAGVEGYGFSASGPDSVISGDVPVQPSLISSTSSPVISDVTTLIFKAAMGSGNYAGAGFSQTIGLTASANI